MDTSSITKRIAMLEKSEAEYKTKKEMLDDALRSDGELQNLEDKAKDAKRSAAVQKEIVLNEPENRKLIEQMKELALEIKDQKKLLGDELIAYFMQNNSLEYVLPSGEKRRIVLSAKFGKGKDEE
jgi:hypothetical protein